MAAGWQTALKDWQDALGPANVSVDEHELAHAAATTFRTSQRPRAILRPSSSDEVSAVVRVAHLHCVPIYVVSGGKNFGLGGRVAPRDGSVILDLGRMKQILEHDEDLAFVRLEPGVTFRELYDFLKSKGSRLYASTTGGSPDGSVVGNALERGDGSGPLGDRALFACALEVVLPTGEIVHTGFDRFEHSAVSNIQRWGVGPALDGLFLQSNLGIVTKMTVWLTPLGRFASSIRFQIVDPAELAAVIDVLRELRLEGTLRAPAGLWNDYRVLSAERSSPARAPRSEVKAALGSDARWFGFTSVQAATEEQGVASVRRIEHQLAPVVDELVVDSRSGTPASGRELFPVDDPGSCFFQGVPHTASLRSVYFKKPGAAPEHVDPDRDRCGVLWACPTLPLRGHDCLAAVELAERLFDQHGFEPLFALLAHSERAAYFVPMLVYDRDNTGEDDRALRCHDEVLSAMVSAGYLPHRLGIQSMSSLPPPRDDFGALLSRLKRAIDPHDVLAPGRYDFRETWPAED
jgi:4-cresol dehydrogenase (hydroxylating)